MAEVCNIVQEAVTKNIPNKKNCKKPNGWFEEALQIAEERREVKSKRESERYPQLNAEFQRIPPRDKAFLNEQCIKLEENNRRGKTRDHFRKLEISREHFAQRWAQ